MGRPKLFDRDEVLDRALDEFSEFGDKVGLYGQALANPETPTGVNGSLNAGRICDVDCRGMADERITGYDPEQRAVITNYHG